MPRPTLALGTYGNIYSTQNTTNGRWTAKARFRDLDGKTRLIERTSTTKAKAERNLKEYLAERAAPHTTTELTRDSRISLLCPLWWAEYEQKDRATNTLRRYKEIMDAYLLPRMGELRLSECSVGRLTNLLNGIASDYGHASAKVTKSVLSNMFAFAAARDAIPRNPMRDVQLPAQPKAQVKALTYFEAVQLREHLTDDVRAILDVLLGTGKRIGEVLALRWQDVDLDAVHPTVNINGTLSHDLNGKLYRQDHPKSKKGSHTVYLPPFVAQMLRERKAHHIPVSAHSTAWATPDAYIFPSTTGSAWEPNNFRKKWRAQVSAAGYAGVNPHAIRKTVATYLANAEGVSAASLQLNHSDEAVTRAHYVARNDVLPDMSALLQAFGSAPVGQ